MAIGLLLRDSYRTTQEGNLVCHTVAKEYRLQCCPSTLSNYMVFLEWDCDCVLQGIRPWGLAMFSGDVQETLHRFEKQAHNEHSPQGGGSSADEGLALGNLRQQSAVNRDSAVLEQSLGWVFMYFDIRVLVHGCVQASACCAHEELEVKVAHLALQRPTLRVFCKIPDCRRSVVLLYVLCVVCMVLCPVSSHVSYGHSIEC